jgi:urea transporter
MEEKAIKRVYQRFFLNAQVLVGVFIFLTALTQTGDWSLIQISSFSSILLAPVLISTFKKSNGKPLRFPFVFDINYSDVFPTEAKKAKRLQVTCQINR